jgi:hypothetical protein
MNYNFNFNTNPEYDLNTSLIDEMINLYGILTKFLKVEKINQDDFVFKDYSSVKTNSIDSFEVYMLPENSENWDNGNYMYSEFGLLGTQNISLFCSKMSMETMGLDIKSVLGNLVVLPNNKIMEITNCDFEVPGINNLFTFNNQKSVYKFSLIPYNFKLEDELDTEDIMHPDTELQGFTNYDTLDKYFDELTTVKQSQDYNAEINDTVQTIQKTNNINNTDIKINKPIIDKSEDDVWGNF